MKNVKRFPQTHGMVHAYKRRKCGEMDMNLKKLSHFPLTFYTACYMNIKSILQPSIAMLLLLQFLTLHQVLFHLLYDSSPLLVGNVCCCCRYEERNVGRFFNAAYNDAKRIAKRDVTVAKRKTSKEKNM